MLLSVCPLVRKQAPFSKFTNRKHGPALPPLVCGGALGAQPLVAAEALKRDESVADSMDLAPCLRMSRLLLQTVQEYQQLRCQAPESPTLC